MDEQVVSSGLSRRDLLKGSVVVGGLVWVAPTLFASPANASQATCPVDQRYAVKHGAPNRGCETPGTETMGLGNCAARGGFTAFRSGCCLEAAGLVTFTESADGMTHTYVLAVGVGLAQAFGKCGNDCFEHADPHDSSSVVQDLDGPEAGQTTVVISCTDLSHSEVVVCMSGSNVPNCP